MINLVYIKENVSSLSNKLNPEKKGKLLKSFLGFKDKILKEPPFKVP